MRKLILLVCLLIAVLAANAADPRFTASTYYKYTGLTADSASSGADASITWGVNQNKLYLYQVEVSMDERSGSANGITILYGSNDNVTFYEIDTLATNFTGTEAQTVDGIVGLQDLTTGVAWRYMKATMHVSTTSTWDFNFIVFRAVAKND
jgi:hypothetical protein